MATKEAVIETLKEVSYPGFSRDIVSFGIVQAVEVSESTIQIKLVIKSEDTKADSELEEKTKEHLQSKFEDMQVTVSVEHQAAPKFSTQAEEEKEAFLTTVKYKIAVASGKGGVGKSTVAVNLAVAMAKLGLKVGLLDVDIYGPSVPLMLGVKEQPYYDGKKIFPIEKFGVQLMSLGFLVDNNEAVIWRGALVHRAIQQLMNDVAWPELDVMLFDMPPGTGDAQLTISQSVALDGAVIVSTPQDVALLDAVKGVKMFRKVNVPIMGIVENMSYFLCPHCGDRTDIFSTGGVRKECQKLETDLLGEIPIDVEIRSGGDNGIPIVQANPDGAQAQAFVDIAKKVREKIETK